MSSTRAAQEARAPSGSGRASFRGRGSRLSGVDAVCIGRPGTYRCRQTALWSAKEAGPIVVCIDRRSMRSVGSCRAKWLIEDVSCLSTGAKDYKGKYRIGVLASGYTLVTMLLIMLII